MWQDNDILGVFSPEAYTHVNPGWGLVLVVSTNTCSWKLKIANKVKGSFVAAFCGVLTIVSTYYPDRPSAPRTFPGGLEAELGGPKTVIARKAEDEQTALG